MSGSRAVFLSVSDLNILNQKISETEAERLSGVQIRRSAFSELEATAARPLETIQGQTEIELFHADVTPYLCLRHRLHRAVKSRPLELIVRMNAQAMASASVGRLILRRARLKSDRLFDLVLQHVRARETLHKLLQAAKFVARETAHRRLQAYSQDLKSAERQLLEATALSKQANKKLYLVSLPVRSGTTSSHDVVGVYESYARQQRRKLDHKYKIARLKLQIARDLGLLAEGAEI